MSIWGSANWFRNLTSSTWWRYLGEKGVKLSTVCINIIEVPKTWPKLKTRASCFQLFHFHPVIVGNPRFQMHSIIWQSSINNIISLLLGFPLSSSSLFILQSICILATVCYRLLPCFRCLSILFCKMIPLSSGFVWSGKVFEWFFFYTKDVHGKSKQVHSPLKLTGLASDLRHYEF